MKLRLKPTLPRAMAALAAIALTLGSIFAGTAHEYDAGSLNIVHPWARPTLGNVKVGATYVTILNEGTASDTLQSAKSDIAERIEIHETVVEGDVAKMQPVASGVEIPADGSAEFVPMGKHIMMMGLKKKLTVGDTFPMTLVFKNQGEVSIEVKVLQPGGKKSSDSGDAKGSHKGSH